MAKKPQAEEKYESDEGYYKQDAPPPVPDATGDTRPPLKADVKTERPPDEAASGVYQPYPAMRYKLSEPVMVVDNADEDAALGEGWSKSPDALVPDVPEVVPVKGKETKP